MSIPKDKIYEKVREGTREEEIKVIDVRGMAMAAAAADDFLIHYFHYSG